MGSAVVGGGKLTARAALVEWVELHQSGGGRLTGTACDLATEFF